MQTAFALPLVGPASARRHYGMVRRMESPAVLAFRVTVAAAELDSSYRFGGNIRVSEVYFACGRRAEGVYLKYAAHRRRTHRATVLGEEVCVQRALQTASLRMNSV